MRNRPAAFILAVGSSVLRLNISLGGVAAATCAAVAGIVNRTISLREGTAITAAVAGAWGGAKVGALLGGEEAMQSAIAGVLLILAAEGGIKAGILPLEAGERAEVGLAAVIVGAGAAAFANVAGLIVQSTPLPYKIGIGMGLLVTLGFAGKVGAEAAEAPENRNNFGLGMVTAGLVGVSVLLNGGGLMLAGACAGLSAGGTFLKDRYIRTIEL